ncbi:hypothetical protein FRC03_002822 [Tulasnella sp. 419]|nr:hypothetical protein FRC03_002822 [Tulasnella sp. 419]
MEACFHCKTHQARPANSSFRRNGQYILIDLTTADAVDWEALRSETPGMNPAVGEDIRAKAALRQLLFIYVSQLAKESLSILGYSITVKDPKDANPVMPSLPPVSVSTQTMPASVDSGSPGKSGDSNAFLFLEMAGDVTGRTAPLNALEGSYAWVRDDESGVMLIGKESLWDRFFVGHLKFINEEALVLVNKLGRWVETGGKEGGSVGDAIPWSLTDSSFPNNLEWTSRDQTSASFSWHDGKKNDKSDWGFGWTSHKREQWDASVKTNVRMDPGTNHLTVNNSISFQYQQANDSTHGRGDTISDLRTEAASVDWDLILAFNSVKGGVLGFDVQVQNLKCSCNLSTQTFGVFQALFGGIIVDDKGKEIMESLIESRMNQIDLAGLVSKALKEQSQFVFPGGGTFFMKDPTFTPDYDLRVSLNYQQRRENQGVTK